MLPSPSGPPPNALAPHASSHREEARPHPPSCASTLWQAIRRTREALELREARIARLAERFASAIRPREEVFTRSVCRLTERLMSHHERATLDLAERTLLGLWIDENLRSLGSHPFAPRADTAALTRRWRGHLDRAVHPLDAALANLHADADGGHPGSRSRHEAEAAGSGPGKGDGRGSNRTGTDRAERADDGDRRAAEEVPGAARRARDARGGRRARDSSGRSRESSKEGGSASRRERGSSGGEWTREAKVAAAETIERDMRALSARLFRRLARALHPDREQDETLKRVKHRLMSDCLRARDEHDIDTLLSLYVTHVGELPDALADSGTDALERLLRVQLHELQRRLRRAHAGDALQTMIADRYALDDPHESDRRFREHADALDGETARAESTIRRVAETEGLHAVLEERREKELDRLWIDEMTGAAPT